MLDLLLTQNHKVKLLNMELTKEQMKLVIGCLSDYKFLDQTDSNPFRSSRDLKELPTVITMFKTYLKGGENNG